MTSSEDSRFDLNQARAKLQAKLAQVHAQLQSLQRADMEAMRSAAHTQYGKRIGDHTVDAQEHTNRLATAGSLERLEHEVRAALLKLDSGSYGYCDRCHQPIAPQRLEVLPWAARCLACEQSGERCRPARRD